MGIRCTISPHCDGNSNQRQKNGCAPQSCAGGQFSASYQVLRINRHISFENRSSFSAGDSLAETTTKEANLPPLLAITTISLCWTALLARNQFLSGTRLQSSFRANGPHFQPVSGHLFFFNLSTNPSFLAGPNTPGLHCLNAIMGV